MLGPLDAEDAAAAGGRGAMATRQGWGFPWRQEAQHPELALGEGCSRWGGRQDQGTPEAAECQSLGSGSRKAPSAPRAAPGLQCLEGVGSRGLAGSRFYAWPCRSPAVPTATVNSGCSQTAPAGCGAGACMLSSGEQPALQVMQCQARPLGFLQSGGSAEHLCLLQIQA